MADSSRFEDRARELDQLKRLPVGVAELEGYDAAGSASSSFREIVVTAPCRILHLENQRCLDVAQGLAKLHGARLTGNKRTRASRS